MKCIFSVDVEDWFHLLDLPAVSNAERWPELPSRVEKNFINLMAIFAESDLPDKWKEYVEINSKYATEWPNINEKKDALPEADSLKETLPKRDKLDVKPFAG